MVVKHVRAHVEGAKRLTSPSDTIDLSWDASQGRGPGYVNGGGVQGIRYRINGGAWVSVHGTRTVRRPNFSPVASKMPDAPLGTMAPFDGYGVILLASSLPTGTITVEAEALDSTLNPAGALDPITFYNDRDGVDRRPVVVAGGQPDVWVDFNAGNDVNSGLGGFGNAVKSIHRAIQIIGPECGGATIHARGDFNRGGGPAGSPGSWSTAGLSWLTIQGYDGCTWQRFNGPGSSPEDYISATGTGAGTRCSIRMRGIRILGGGPILYCSAGVHGRAWREGCRWGSPLYEPGGPRVLYLETEPNGIGAFSVEGSPASLQTMATGEERWGCGIGYSAETLVYDCEIRGNLGGNIYMQGDQKRSKYLCVVCYDHNYSRNVTRGWGCNREGDTLADLQPLESQDMGGGIMRILGPVGGYRFDLALADNINSQRTRLGIRAWPGVGTDPTGRIIRGTGLSGGRPYVDIEHTGTYGPAPAGAEIETVAEWNPGSGSWAWFNDRIHPSFFSYGTGRIGGDVFHSCATYDSQNTVQASFANGFAADHQDVWFKNCRDAGDGYVFNAVNAYHLDCLWENCTFSGSLSISGGEDYAGSQMINCVWRDQSGLDAAIGLGMSVVNCHFIQGSLPAGAINSTSGAWFKSDPLLSFEPLDARKGTGSSLVDECDEWQWAATPTRGVFKNTALGSWAVAGVDPLFLAGTSTGTSTDTGLLGLRLNLAGSSSGTSTDVGAPTFRWALLGISGGASSDIGHLVVPRFVDIRGVSIGSSTETGLLISGQALAGTSFGTSTDSGLLTRKIGLAGTSTGSSTDQLALGSIVAASGTSDGLSEDVGFLALQTDIILIGLSSGSSTTSASLSSYVGLAGTSAGLSTSIGTLVSTLVLSGTSAGTANDLGFMILQSEISPAPVQVKKVLMKQRIHNALLAAVKAGPYYRCTVNSKTGQMTIDLDQTVSPSGVKIAETQATYSIVSRMKRFFGASQRESWSWVAKVTFNGIEVACEEFEEAAIDRGIQIPPVIGLANQRRLLARLVRADYSHPPEQSPSGGTVAEFSFEVVTELLRK